MAKIRGKRFIAQMRSCRRANTDGCCFDVCKIRDAHTSSSVQDISILLLNLPSLILPIMWIILMFIALSMLILFLLWLMSSVLSSLHIYNVCYTEVLIG